MLNFPFYNKHANHIILDKNLRDYIKKSNTDSFNKFSEQRQQYKNTNTNSNNSLLVASLMNYRNYSETFANNQIDDSELEKEGYFCDLSDLSDCDCDCYYISNNNTNNNTNKNKDNNTNKNTNKSNNNTIIKKMYILIAGTTSIIGIGAGIALLYYKYF
jgi:hypothetical protein